MLARRPHPEQGFRTCLGILRLFRGIDAARAEAVSVRAVEIGALNYQSVASILEHRLDQDGAAHRGRRAAPARQHPRFPLLPLRRTTLLQHPTIDRLRELGLDGMAKSLRDLAANPESKALDHMEWLGILLEHEMTLRQQKRFEAAPGPPSCATWPRSRMSTTGQPRGLDRTLFLKLAGCDWIREHRHCLLTGPDRGGDMMHISPCY